MLEKNNDDSSSSEDEISKNAIKEATDHQLLKEHYFSNEKFKNADVSKKPDERNSRRELIEINSVINPISLRKKLEFQDTFSNFGVTPTFQNYVAKKLDEILEKSIKIKKKKTDNIINEKDNESNNYGIKLLNSSSEFLIVEEDFPKFQKKRKIETNIEEKANLLKCKEVAVDPEHILSKIDTKAWTNKRKEVEFNYKKLKNGTLVEKPNNRCNKRSHIYTCPRCEIKYCSADCYKSEAHLECSESFYKQCVINELKSQEKNAEDRQKMLKILKRVHEQDLEDMEILENDEIDEESEEQLDSDDEENISDLEKRLYDINLDNADEVWSVLTNAEKQEFEALIKNGDIDKFLPKWIPWWIHCTKKNLVEDMDQTYDEQAQKLPPLIDVPIFNELQKASPNVKYNVINVIYAYAYIANYYNGDYLNCPVEATIVFLDLSENMKYNKVYENSESAITSVVHKIISCNWLPQDEQTLLVFKEAGNIIMQGSEKERKYLYIAVALSELYRLLLAATKEISKNKNDIGNKKFFKKFVRYKIDNINLSKKMLFLYRKKLEYYLSWTKNCNINMYL